MEHITLQPCGNTELFYSNSSREAHCIGHLRGDFGHDGLEFHTSWWPHEAHDHNTPRFKDEFHAVLDTLWASLLMDRPSMRRYLREHPSIIDHDGCVEHHGYHAQTDAHDFYIRCNPCNGDYNFYIYCYVREEVSVV